MYDGKLTNLYSEDPIDIISKFKKVKPIKSHDLINLINQKLNLVEDERLTPVQFRKICN